MLRSCSTSHSCFVFEGEGIDVLHWITEWKVGDLSSRKKDTYRSDHFVKLSFILSMQNLIANHFRFKDSYPKMQIIYTV